MYMVSSGIGFWNCVAEQHLGEHSDGVSNSPRTSSQHDDLELLLVLLRSENESIIARHRSPVHDVASSHLAAHDAS
jgi:hypothetical protein